MAAFEIVLERPKVSEEEWRARRREGIGGSDAPAIAGLGRKTALSVYLDKIGQGENVDNAYMRMGRYMEPLIRDTILPAEFERVEGKKLRTNQYPFMIRSCQRPWMFANLDGTFAVTNEDHEIEGGGLEIKWTTNPEEWVDGGVPDAAYTQVQHCLAVTRWPRFLVVGVIGPEVVWRMVEPNEEFIDALAETERVFWEEHVKAGIPPEPTATEEDRRILAKLYPGSDDAPEVDLSAEAVSIEEYLAAKAEIKRLEEKAVGIQTRLQAMMRDARSAACGSRKITWTRFETRRFDTERYKQDHPEEYEQYAKVSASSRFTVK